MHKIIILLFLVIGTSIAEQPELLWKCPRADLFNNIDINEENTKFVVSGVQEFKVFDLNTKQLINIIPHNHGRSYHATAFFISNNDLLLFKDGEVCTYNLTTKEEDKVYNSFGDNYNPILSPTKDMYAIFDVYVEEDQMNPKNFDTIKVVNIEQKKIIGEFAIDYTDHIDNKDFINSFHFSKDGMNIIMVTKYSFIFVWNIETGKLINKFNMIKELFNDEYAVGYWQTDWISDSLIIANFENWPIFNYFTDEFVEYSGIDLSLRDFPKISNDKKYMFLTDSRNNYIFDVNKKVILDTLNLYAFVPDDSDVFFRNEKSLICKQGEVLFKYNFEQKKIVEYYNANDVKNIFIQKTDHEHKIYTTGEGLSIIDGKTGKVDQYIYNEKAPGITLTMNNNFNQVVGLDYLGLDYNSTYCYNFDIYDLSTENSIKITNDTIKTVNPVYVEAKFSPEDKYLALHYESKNYFKILETKNYTTVDSIGEVTSFDFAEDNKRILCKKRDTADNRTIVERDFINKEDICVMESENPYGQFKYISNDKVIGDFYNSYHLNQFYPCGEIDFDGYDTDKLIKQFEITKDKKYIILSTYDTELMIFDFQSKEIVYTFDMSNEIEEIYNFQISDEGKNIAVRAKDFIYYYDLGSLLSAVDITVTSRQELNISPTPCDEVCYISGCEDLQTINIFDLYGRKVKSINTNYQSKIEFNVSDLPNGTYIVKGICQDNSTITKKIIVYR